MHEHAGESSGAERLKHNCRSDEAQSTVLRSRDGAGCQGDAGVAVGSSRAGVGGESGAGGWADDVGAGGDVVVEACCGEGGLLAVLAVAGGGGCGKAVAAVGVEAKCGGVEWAEDVGAGVGAVVAACCGVVELLASVLAEAGGGGSGEAVAAVGVEASCGGVELLVRGAAGVG